MGNVDDIEWIVNDGGELGVKIGQRFAYCYKGRSIDYGGTHDDGSPMLYRAVGKREFGETVHPLAECKGEIVVDADGRYRKGDDWKPMPTLPSEDDRVALTFTYANHGGQPDLHHDIVPTREQQLRNALRDALDLAARALDDVDSSASTKGNDRAEYDRMVAKLGELMKMLEGK